MRDERWKENPDLEAEEGPTVPEWRDALGQEFRPGDLIMVATVSGRSPQMVVAEVIKINTHNSKGERHTKTVHTGRRLTLTRERRVWIGDPELKDFYTAMDHAGGARVVRSFAQQEKQRARLVEFRRAQSDEANWRVEEEEYETDEMWEVQAVTVTARPVLDGRGFGRTDASRRWTGSEYVEVEGAEKTRPVTYSIIGNIIRCPESMLSLLAEAEPGRRVVDW